MRVLVKVVMVLLIILTMWHLASSFGRNQRRKRDLKSFDKREGTNDGDWYQRDGVGKEPIGVGGDVDVLEKEIEIKNGDMPPQIDVEQGDNTPKIGEEKNDRPPDVENGDTIPHIGEEKGDKTPLILLWNNYQGDKSALYNKIFHR